MRLNSARTPRQYIRHPHHPKQRSLGRGLRDRWRIGHCVGEKSRTADHSPKVGGLRCELTLLFFKSLSLSPSVLPGGRTAPGYRLRSWGAINIYLISAHKLCIADDCSQRGVEPEGEALRPSTAPAKVLRLLSGRGTITCAHEPPVYLSSLRASVLPQLLRASRGFVSPPTPQDQSDQDASGRDHSVPLVKYCSLQRTV